MYALFIEAPTNLFHATPIKSLLLAEPVVMVVVIAVLGVGPVRDEAESHLRRSADTDALTGVRNRGAFFTGGEELIRLARRDRTLMALILLDLHHFKTINDRYGIETDALCDRGRGDLLDAADQDGELLAADPPDDVGGADHVGSRRSRRLPC
jgi:hypothetical protein